MRARAIYEERGPTAAAEALECSKGTISAWARAGKWRTVRNEKTAAAVEARRTDLAKRREDMRDRLMDEIHETLDRLRQPQIAFVGQQGKQVEYPRPPAQDHFALVKSIGTLIDKFRLESGEATERTEQINQSEFDREVADLVKQVRQAA